jgi:FAD/FMN-containing dehydrogenase
MVGNDGRCQKFLSDRTGFVRDVADVRAAVNFARQERLTVAIRGGGHNGAGLGVCAHGLVSL